MEEKIRVKQIRMGKTLETNSVLLEKHKKLVNENKGEILNQNGISTKAQLKLTIYEAKDLPTKNLMGNSRPFVQITVGNRKEKTTFKNDSINPVWNEDFVIHIDTLQEELKIEIYDKDHTSQKDVLGALTIPLISLKNQEKKEEWQTLNTDDDSLAKIHIKTELNWSLYQLAVNNVKKIEEKISRITNDMKNLEKFMDLFQKPFGILLYVEIDDEIQKVLWEDKEDYLKPSNEVRKTITAPMRNSHLMGSVDNIFQTTLSKIM